MQIGISMVQELSENCICLIIKGNIIIVLHWDQGAIFCCRERKNLIILLVKLPIEAKIGMVMLYQ